MTEKNILMFVCDQLRFDCLGAYGNEQVNTKNINMLAKDGTLYTNSFCSSPSCTPSRYSLLTGLYPHQHQGHTNESTIPFGTETLPGLLKDNGYHTKLIGKMHFTPTYLDIGYGEMELAEQTPDGRYEDDYHLFLKSKGYVDEVDALDQIDELRMKGSEKYWKRFGAVESNLPLEYDSTYWIGKKAIDSIRKWDERTSHFLTVGFIKPHHPFDPPKPWSSYYNPNNLTLLDGWVEECLPRDLEKHEGFFKHKNLTKQSLKDIMAYYYANISHIDEQIGQVIKTLKEKGLYENTLIIFTSDHGEFMGFHHLLLKSNHMYDPVMKVPLIIKYPYQTNKGTISDKLISNIDIAPTILSLSGSKIGDFMNGIKINHTTEERKWIFAQGDRGKDYMIRTSCNKLLWNNETDKSLFFNLNNDPLEFVNLYNAPDYKDLIREHKNALINMVLFQSPAPVHLNKQAPTIKKTSHSIKDWVMGQMENSNLLTKEGMDEKKKFNKDVKK